MSGQLREHGIASYNKGCKCASCLEAKRRHVAKYRSQERKRREPMPDDVICPGCGGRFRRWGSHWAACMA